MAGFDPDAYLQDTAPAFNPDAFLAPPPKPGEPGAPSVPISGVPQGDQSTAKYLPPKPVANDRPFINTASSVLDSATLGITRGPTATFGAALEGLTNKYPGTSFDDRRRNILQALRERKAQTTEDLGVAGPAIDAVASLPANYYLGGGSKAMGLGEMVLRSMIPSGIEGISKNAESLGTMIRGAAKDMATSAAFTYGLGKAGKLLPGGRAAAAADAQDARGIPPVRIEADAANIYRDLDNGGFRWSRQQGRALRQELAALRQSGDFDPAAHRELTGYFNTLDARARGALSFSDLQNIKSKIAEVGRGDNAALNSAARGINSTIERFVANQPPAYNPNNINVAQLWPEASRLTRQSKVAAKTQADFDAPAGTAEIPGKRSVELGQRDVADRMLKKANNPEKYSPFEHDPQARELLANIRRGGEQPSFGPTLQNAAGTTGRFLNNKVAPVVSGVVGALGPAAIGYSRDAGTAMTALSALGFGGTAAAATAGLGRGLQSVATSQGQKNVDALSRYLTSGNTTRSPYGSGITRDDLARLMTEQNFIRLLGQTPSGE